MMGHMTVYMLPQASILLLDDSNSNSNRSNTATTTTIQDSSWKQQTGTGSSNCCSRSPVPSTAVQHPIALSTIPTR